MVGPIPGEDRRTAGLWLAAGFVVLVGLSAALIAVYGGATPIEVGGVAIVGLLTGIATLLALGVRP